MRTIKRDRALPGTPGFTLPAVLVITAALLILAIGVLAISGLERASSRSQADRERASLAALAGLEEVGAILTRETSNDDFLVIRSQAASPVDTSRPDKQRAAHLFATRGKAAGSGYSYSYQPLFSSLAKPADAALAKPAVEPLLGADPSRHAVFPTLPYLDKVRTAWTDVRNDRGDVVGRYAFWVEDLQARIDPTLAGNNKGAGGTHTRAPWPFPAPGLNPLAASATQPAADQIALFSIDPLASEFNQGTLGKTLLERRNLLLSPGSPLAAAGFAPPLARLDSRLSGSPIPQFDGLPGQLENPAARAVEESLYPGIRTYREQALVPFASGIHPSVAGTPKKNLNQLLATGGNAAVTEMSDFIDRALPLFSARKGGFPDDYLKTLAANTLDYADGNGEPLAGTGFRGIDAYPLVSEFLMRFRWEDAPTAGGRKYLVLSASTYVELWNHTDQTVSGTVRVSYENAYSFPLGANPSVSLSDLSPATPVLTLEDGYRWFPEFPVLLKPNEYRIHLCGTVTYRIDAGPASFFIPSPLTLTGETFGARGSGYRMKWNGRLADQSRGAIHRNDSTIHYPSGGSRQSVRATVPSHSHNRGSGFLNNMGDPRMSFYNNSPQDANSYPENYSPNRRNVRFGTIYRDDGSTKPKTHGRVMPSEWPDGGHNSTYDSNLFYTTSTNYNPDDPRFFPSATSPLRNPTAHEAPTRLSNIGRFHSATELGRVYDPLMWNVAPPISANGPWGDVTGFSASSPCHGGGNTLRIGRPEHPRFDIASSPGQEAWRLLDLFHAGISRSPDPVLQRGPLQNVEGLVNLNTADRATIRALAYGALTMDPGLCRRTSESHNTTTLMAPPTVPASMTAAEIAAAADAVADGVIRLRDTAPLSSPAAAAEARNASGNPVFGSSTDPLLQMSDSAKEELFARIHETSTVRSRNFRVWIVGQAVKASAGSANPTVLAEVRRCHTIFADPGERKPDGSIDPAKLKIHRIHETDF